LNVKGFEWSGKKVLVTGASGFKGSWLCKVLHKLGADVYGITRQVLNPISSYNLLELEETIVKVPADITVPRQVFDVLNNIAPDVIFHLAAKAQVPVALRDPIRTFDVNVMGTLNILEACRKYAVAEKLLIVSTDHVFGFITAPCVRIDVASSLMS
jgi:CDP-glucose 4,6-dehydratase